MVIARLIGSRAYRAKVYKDEGKWYIGYSWETNIGTVDYPSWEKAYRQACLKVSLMRLWF